MADTPNTAEAGKPRRRWFQFRLRTLLVGVVLIGTACGYVAHEARIVEARKTWIETHESACMDESRAPAATGFPEKGPSIIRRMLGDQRYTVIFVSSSDDLTDVKSLFPEAFVELKQD